MLNRVICCGIVISVALASQTLAVGEPQAAATSPPPAESQVMAGKELYRSKGSCVFCHGWAGDGHGDAHSAGNAANLRRTRLSRAQLFEVISCGRPGTSMPHFDAYAYTDDPCYGLQGAEAAEAIPPKPPRPLQPREIEAIIDFLSVKVIDRGAPTRQECIEFFSEAGPCSGY